MSRAQQDMFEVGVVTGLHGLRGDLKVKTHTPGSASLLAARQVSLHRVAEPQPLACEVARAVLHKGAVLLRLRGFESIEAVSSFKGAAVFMPLADLPEPEEDESYWYELEGAEVFDERLGLIGVLEDVFETAAHDIYVVRGQFGEVMIPAVDELILEFDEEKKHLHVDLPDGLVNETLGDARTRHSDS